jgi:hypothetical protein
MCIRARNARVLCSRYVGVRGLREDVRRRSMDSPEEAFRCREANSVVVLAAAGCDSARGKPGCTNGELRDSLYDSTTCAARASRADSRV